MCEFMSCISDGKGKVLFFTVEDIIKIKSEGNKKNYEWNSHTSIADYNGIKGLKEDKWNKWEYCCDKKELKSDSLVTTDDKEQVKIVIEKYLTSDNTVYLRNLYCNNSGDRNSGDGNSGDGNSGNSNSGYSNSGYRNSGYSNSGNRNSGDSNSGYSNSGYRNSGYSNSGNRNSGDRNSGDRNSGDGNSGDGNSGNRNSGNRNSGHFNSDTPKTIRVFNKNCSRKKWDNAVKPYFIAQVYPTRWISFLDMTEEEKKADLLAEMREGYLRTFTYKEAWANAYATATPEDIKLLKKLPNFNKKVFKEITGIDVK